MNTDGRIILITGGTGSFGNFITYKLINETNVKEVRILSRDEKKQYDMRIHYKNDERLKLFIGDIRDDRKVQEVMRDVDIVFQAAALKQVPTCEYMPMEAVKTNILGAYNVIRAAIKECVKKVITISTDKAVKAVNVMGMTKAIQERINISANLSPLNRGTIFSCVRYGNVMSSRGSVIPFFRKKLLNSEVLTITDIEMTRFLLTLGDAIDLVIFAIEDAQGGEIYVKKSPSARIFDLARVLSENAGKEFKYEIIGKYPGEKLHEILITEEELQRTKDKGAYFVVYPWWGKEVFSDLNEEYCSSGELITSDEIIRSLINRSDLELKDVSIEEGDFSKI